MAFIPVNKGLIFRTKFQRHRNKSKNKIFQVKKPTRLVTSALLHRHYIDKPFPPEKNTEEIG